MTSVSLRADLAVCGVAVDAPVAGRDSLGPADDGHMLLDGVSAALPFAPRSKYTVREGRLLLNGADLGLGLAPVRRPRFYDLATAEGIPYEQIARLHCSDVLAATVVQTCVRYAADERCRFCGIEESLRRGDTTAVKSPAQLAEVAEAAVRLDGVTQMLLTTGTSAGRDRGARHLVRCAAAVAEAVPALPMQVQVEPPGELGVLTELRAAGVVSIGIHVESLDDDVRRRWTPGKARVPLAEYRAAWREAVRVFGRNQVSTYLLIGLGEDPDDLVDGAAELIDLGVYPFVVPFRPIAGTLAVDVDSASTPPSWQVADVTDRIAELLVAAGMRGADQGAGCATCGACSALSTAGG